MVVRDAILEAAQEYAKNGSILGLKGFCAKMRDDEPVEFWRGLVKLLPKDVDVRVPEGITVTIERSFVKSKEGE